MSGIGATNEWVGALVRSMERRTGPLTGDRDWAVVKEWPSFSARFVLVESGPDRIALKLGTNWEDGAVTYVADETSRVSKLMADLPSGRVAMPGVLGVASDPPAMALQYFEGTPLFDVLPTLEHREREAVLRLCGQAIGAFHAAEEVPDEPRIRSAASAELFAAARRSLIRRETAARTEPALARARSYRFSPNDFLLTEEQALVLLDPPHVQKFDYVHRDIASFFMEMHRSLVGERRPSGSDESHSVRRAGDVFLDGYRETGPVALDRDEDLWTIDLFQTARVVGVARGRARSGMLGPARSALAWAFWLRKSLSAAEPGAGGK